MGQSGFVNLIKKGAKCMLDGHEWEKLDGGVFEYDGKDPMYLWVCLECEETKVDF